MALLNGLPVQGFPGFQWASTAPAQVQELVTVYDLEEIDALNSPPDADIAWADVGTHVSQGTGVVKIVHRLPQSSAFVPFQYGGTRTYNAVDVAASVVRVNPWDLSYAWPMIWDQISNGFKLMSQGANGDLMEFTGASGLASEVVTAGRAYKAQLVASLFIKGLTSSALGLTAEALTMPQPGLPNGNALFTNGTDSPSHYAHPLNANSGRFNNAFAAYGNFADNFGRSLVNMTQKPHPTLPNLTSGARVTDVIGPTYMRDRFWQMAVQTLTLQKVSNATTAIVGGAAVSNAYAERLLQEFSSDTFIGASGFTPYRFWICPQLDQHPYYTANSNANMTTGPGGGPADMWINISAGPKRATWAKLASNSKAFVPIARYYGEGDPRAMSERRARIETDLDAGVAAGAYGEIDMFFGV